MGFTLTQHLNLRGEPNFLTFTHPPRRSVSVRSFHAMSMPRHTLSLMISRCCSPMQNWGSPCLSVLMACRLRTLFHGVAGPRSCRAHMPAAASVIGHCFASNSGCQWCQCNGKIETTTPGCGTETSRLLLCVVQQKTYCAMEKWEVRIGNAELKQETKLSEG